MQHYFLLSFLFRSWTLLATCPRPVYKATWLLCITRSTSFSTRIRYLSIPHHYGRRRVLATCRLPSAIWSATTATGRASPTRPDALSAAAASLRAKVGHPPRADFLYINLRWVSPYMCIPGPPSWSEHRWLKPERIGMKTSMEYYDCVLGFMLRGD